MSWDKVKKTVGKIAPVLGSAINPVFGGAAGALIAAALGVDEEPEEIYQAIKNDPEAAIKLQQIQNQHKEKLSEIAMTREANELADKQNARAMHRHSRMPAIICAALTVMVAASIYFLFTLEVPEANHELIYIMFGQVTALWGASVTYWVGTTRSSAEKTRLSAIKTL